MVLAVCVTTSVGVSAQEKQKRFQPSYDEGAEYVNEHPAKEPSVLPYFTSWKDSKAKTGHGGFIEQDMFTRGDPAEPPDKGAVFKYLKVYSHGILHGMQSTELVRHDREQVLFYVMNGSGRVEAGGKSEEIRDGSGILIPAGLEYRFVNTGNVILEVIIVVEEIPGSFKPRKDMVVRNYRDVPCGFWGNYVTYNLLSSQDGLYEPLSMAVITMDTYSMGVQHFHFVGCEEIWLKVGGEENPCVLGKQLLRMNIGDAFFGLPLVPHSVINNTESRMMWLYVADRRDKQKSQ